jgi:hypothetical protein
VEKEGSQVQKGLEWIEKRVHKKDNRIDCGHRHAKKVKWGEKHEYTAAGFLSH